MYQENIERKSMQITNNIASNTVPFSSVKKGSVLISTLTGKVFIKIQRCGDMNAVNLDTGLKATFAADERVIPVPNAVLTLA